VCVLHSSSASFNAFGFARVYLFQWRHNEKGFIGAFELGGKRTYLRAPRAVKYREHNNTL